MNDFVIDKLLDDQLFSFDLSRPSILIALQYKQDFYNQVASLGFEPVKIEFSSGYHSVKCITYHRVSDTAFYILKHSYLYPNHICKIIYKRRCS